MEVKEYYRLYRVMSINYLKIFHVNFEEKRLVAVNTRKLWKLDTRAKMSCTRECQEGTYLGVKEKVVRDKATFIIQNKKIMDAQALTSDICNQRKGKM